MNNQDFNCTIKTSITAKDAVVGINNVARWWATKVTGSSQQINDVFTVIFGKTFATIKIIEIVPERKIVWHVIESLVPLFKNDKQWNDTKMVWEISEMNNSTEINFTHIGLTPETECYNDCVQGWSFFVKESLLKLLTEKQGLPRTGITAYFINRDRKYEGLLYYKNDTSPQYTDGYIFIDVKETSGEQVISAYNTGAYKQDSFETKSLQGEYFMILKNSPVQSDITPLEDILTTI